MEQDTCPHEPRTNQATPHARQRAAHVCSLVLAALIVAVSAATATAPQQAIENAARTPPVDGQPSTVVPFGDTSGSGGSSPRSDSAITSFPNCRFGVAATRNPICTYAYSDLNIGWFVNYGTSNPCDIPAGVEFVRIVRVHQAKTGWCRDCYTVPFTYTASPGLDELAAQAAAQPGSTWLIGNEPDRRDWDGGGQDEMTPGLYAQAYHEIARAIRGADSGARLAIGGVMQVTPLRLEYLDRVWEEYETRFGRRLGDDVDIWNAHGFVLPESRDDWGAEIPPGLDEAAGMQYDVDDNDSLGHFAEQIRRFRVWMRDRGERDKPLYLSEYGVNMPLEYISRERVQIFLQRSFDFLLESVDAELGCPTDGNRLVQRFLWYSLDDSADSPGRIDDYGDALFSSVTHGRLPYGDTWAAYVHDALHPESGMPQVNLSVAWTDVSVAADVFPAEPWPVTLQAWIVNSGNTRTASPAGIAVRFWRGRNDGRAILIGTQRLGDLWGCGYGVLAEQPLAMTAAELAGLEWYVEIEPIAGESRTDDNVAPGEGCKHGGSACIDVPR